MDHETTTLVSEIKQRITDTREELRAVEETLATIPQRKETVLGGASFDDAALATLEEEESSLIRKRDYLSKRIPLLEKQQEQAAATAAQARIRALVDESTSCRTEYDQLRAAFDQAADALRTATERLVAGYHAMLALYDEQSYLVERYHEFDVHPAKLSDVGEKMPDDEEVARTTLEPLRMFWLRQGSFGARSDWQRKLQDLENRRRDGHQREANLTIPGHLRRTIG